MTSPASTPRSAIARHAELVAGIAAIVLGIAVMAAVPQLRHCVSLVLDGKFAGLRSYVRSLGAGGVALLLGLTVLHAIVFYPGEIITTTAGYVWGFWTGLAIAASGWFMCAVASYALGRGVGRPLLRRILGRRFDWLTAMMERGGISLLLAARLIPIVPFAPLGYAAGATHVKFWRFAWTSVVGYLPLTTAVTYLGSRAQSLSTGSPVVWALVAVIVVLLASQRLLRARIFGDRGTADPDAPQP